MWLQRLIGLAVILLPGYLLAQEDTVRSALIADRLDTAQLGMIYSLARQYPLGGEVAIALLEGDQVTYYGARRVDGQVVPVENSGQAFAIGSVTKVFTATLLADAVVKGELALTDSVQEAFDFPFADGGNFTYEQLATHTAGLPRLPSNLPLTFADPYGAYTPADLEAYLQNDLRTDVPEAGYSNLGFGILGYVLSRQAGKSYPELLRRLLDQYGMTHTSVGPDSTQAVVVTGYSPDGTTPQPWLFTDAMAGAGAIYSTAEDMERFVRAQFDTTDAVLTLTQEPRVEQNGRQSIGLGWQIIVPEPGRQIHWHNGAVGGYRSFVGMDVENQRGVVVLTNVLLMGQEVDATGMQLLRSLGTQ